MQSRWVSRACRSSSSWSSGRGPPWAALAGLTSFRKPWKVVLTGRGLPMRQLSAVSCRGDCLPQRWMSGGSSIERTVVPASVGSEVFSLHSHPEVEKVRGSVCQSGHEYSKRSGFWILLCVSQAFFWGGYPPTQPSARPPKKSGHLKAFSQNSDPGSLTHRPSPWEGGPLT